MSANPATALVLPSITFEGFPKIPRLRRDVVITEKIDGTNAAVIITDTGEIGAQSRTRLLTPGKDTDNFGFAAWVRDNREDLLKLGPGRHFGEWYGVGIQRGYGIYERRFALFNTHRWNDLNPNRPACCGVVPVLGGRGGHPMEDVQKVIDSLRSTGSLACPGYMQPEGAVIFHSASKQLFKVLLENDDTPKGQA